jgi:hypothetical protein
MFLPLALVVVACQAPRSRIEVEGPTEELCREVTVIAERIVPELEAEFGVRSGLLRIVIDPVDSPRGYGGETDSRGMRLYPVSTPWLIGVIAHEVVHWLLHWQDTYWNALPFVLEEGIAYLAYFEYNDLEIPPSSAGDEEIARMLLLTHDEYKSLEEKLPTIYAATHVARDLGLQNIRELVLRARRDGYETVPVEWVIDALAKVAEAREAERATDPARAP